MTFNDYERICDTLMYLSKEWRLTYTVSLSNKDRYGNRKFFYSEYKYQSKYNNYGDIVSVKRQFKGYLCIENIGNYKNSVVIMPGDMPLFRASIISAVRWLNNGEIFVLNQEKKLTISQEVATQCQMGNYGAIKLEPVIIPNQNNELSPGIRMYINDDRNYFDIESRDFMAMYELLRNFDFYVAACSMIASLPMTSDDAAVNRSDLESEMDARREDYNRSSNYGKGNVGKGFFDK